MSLDNLLIWMSARGKGTWQQFRAAVEEIYVEPNTGENTGEVAYDDTTNELPEYQMIRFGLQRLGHVEFFSSGFDKGWRVVPPSLAITYKNQQWVGIACGARSPELYSKLTQHRNSVSWDILDVTGIPARIRGSVTELDELYAAARSLGFFVQENASVALLAAVPPVDDKTNLIPTNPPAGVGWSIERFSTSTLRWIKAERRDIDAALKGLFRLRMKFQRFYFLKWKQNIFEVPPQIGKFAILSRRKRRRILVYNSREGKLSIPAICRPPLLIERAIILCSGFLPRFVPSNGCIEYTEVPREVVNIAAQLLRQEVQTYE